MTDECAICMANVGAMFDHTYPDGVELTLCVDCFCCVNEKGDYNE